MAQESPVTIVDQPEDGKTHSLLSKVKEKAKGTVQKLTSKVKKGSGSDNSTEELSSASGGQVGEESTSDDLEELSASEAQRESNGGTQTSGIDGVQEDPNGSEQRVSFGIKPEDDRLKVFARSEAEKNPLTATPLIATPTSYGEPHTTVEDVMPPSIIEPKSVSERGEESSSNLGNIPEARDDEEKAAAKEVTTGGPDADINEGFKKTFRQKDLRAIDGLPKPKGFDVGNEDKVHSGDLGFHKSQALADQTISRETEGNAEGFSKGGDIEFPVDGAAQSRVTEEDNEKSHPRGSAAEFTDSMFTSHAIHDLKPNEPTAAEAKRLDEIGTFSRDFEPEAEKSSGTDGDQQHPPGSTAEFKDSMFSSGATHDLKPNEPNAAEAKRAGEIGTFSRDFDPEVEKSSGTNGDQQHPPGSTAEFKDSMFSSGATHDLKPNEPNAAEAKHAGDIGTFSRDFDPEAEKSSGTDGDQQHPPGSTAEFKDSMFSSDAAHDLKPNEPNAAEAKHAGEVGTFSRDFDPEAGKSSGTEGDQQHPPGSTAEFKDSMFSSGATHDLKPNEPNAAEAKRAGEIGTFSRDFDPEVEKSSGTEGDKQHPPGSTAEFKDSMFNSGATHDLKPNEPNAAEAKHAGDIGTFSRGAARDLKPSQTDQPSLANKNSEGAAPILDLPREGESESNAIFQDAPQALPPPALAGDAKDSRQIDDSSAGKGASFGQGNEPMTEEEEAESYFDAVSDDEALGSQPSLDSDMRRDFNPEATDEYEKQRNSLAESANSRVKAAMNDEVEASRTHSASTASEGTSTMLASTLRSVVDSVGSKVGLVPAPQSSSSQSQASTVHSTTSDSA